MMASAEKEDQIYAYAIFRVLKVDVSEVRKMPAICRSVFELGARVMQVSTSNIKHQSINAINL